MPYGNSVGSDTKGELEDEPLSLAFYEKYFNKDVTLLIV